MIFHYHPLSNQILMNYYKIIRVFLLGIIVLLGLTAFFPEWLDVVNMMIGEHKVRALEEQLSTGSSSSAWGELNARTWESMRSAPERITSSIHHIIIGPLFDKPKPGFLMIFVILVWYVLAFILYSLFIMFVVLAHGFIYIQSAPHIKTFLLSPQPPVVVHIFIAGLAFIITLFLWPYITGSIVVAIKALLYLLAFLNK